MRVKGYLDGVSRDRVWGWAFDPDHPDRPVNLVVLADGAVVARVVASAPRADVRRHLKVEGDFGFRIQLPSPLRGGVRHVIEVRREEDGAPLGNSPRILQEAASFDKLTRAEWQAILAAAATDEDHQARLEFLLEETEKQRAIYARRNGGLEERERARRRRWAGPANAREVERSRALFLDETMPDLQRDAGSNAVYSHIRALQRLGYDVSFAPASLTGDSAGLEAIGVQVYKRPWVDSIESLLRQQAGAYDKIYLHRISTASKYIELARAHQPLARIIYSVADLHHVRLARQATVERRPELMALAEITRRREIAAAWAADAVITHSRVEAQVLAKYVPSARIFVVPWATTPRPVATPFAERSGLAFIAGFGHEPNVDAAHWLASSIMPEVWRRHPDIKCLLVGSQPPPTLKALASERVEVVGFVPELDAVFERVRLTVAPLAFGAGIKGKVLDSLAAGIPCICTPIAAEGFGFAPPLSKLIGADPTEIAALIVKMHEDAHANAESAEAGLRFVKAFASEETVDARLRDAFQA